MKSRWLFTITLLLSLGLSACSPNTSRAPVPTTSSSLTPTIEPSLTIEITEAAPTAITTTPVVATPTRMPTNTPTVLSCWSEGGSIKSQQIESDLLDEPIIYRIYLSPCYEQQPDMEYATLYLFHGQTYTEDQWDRLGIDEAANKLIADQEIPPLLIVMPFEEDDRNPPPENQYGLAFVRELLPHIDETFRTLTDREHRAIGGLSRGGNWAINIGLSNWSKFGIIGAHSTPSFVTDGPPRIRELLNGIPHDMLPRIYMDAGADDLWREHALRLEAIFTEENIPHEWHQFEGAHEEEYWAIHIEDYLLWYTQSW